MRSTEVIDSDTTSIKEKAHDRTEGLATAKGQAVALFYFVRDEIKHEPYAAGYVLEDYRASTTLERGNGFCTHKAILLVALARVVGIPARLGFADIRDHLLSYKFRKMIGGGNLLIYHGYAELYIDSRWVHASPAIDLERCRQSGFIPVEFDGVNDFRDPPFNRRGRKHIEYVREHGHYEDFPWDEITEAGSKFWAHLGKDWNEIIVNFRIAEKAESGVSGFL